MRELLYVVAVPMTSLLGLVAFVTWWSAAIFVSGLAGFSVYAVRRHEKHRRSDVHESKLTADRMHSAREWLLDSAREESD